MPSSEMAASMRSRALWSTARSRVRQGRRASPARRLARGRARVPADARTGAASFRRALSLGDHCASARGVRRRRAQHRPRARDQSERGFGAPSSWRRTVPDRTPGGRAGKLHESDCAQPRRCRVLQPARQCAARAGSIRRGAVGPRQRACAQAGARRRPQQSRSRTPLARSARSGAREYRESDCAESELCRRPQEPRRRAEGDEAARRCACQLRSCDRPQSGFRKSVPRPRHRSCGVGPSLGRHRELRRGDCPRSQIGSVLQQSRQCPAGAGAFRRRARELRSRDRRLTGSCGGLVQSWRRPSGTETADRRAREPRSRHCSQAGLSRSACRPRVLQVGAGSFRHGLARFREPLAGQDLLTLARAHRCPAMVGRGFARPFDSCLLGTRGRRHRSIQPLCAPARRARRAERVSWCRRSCGGFLPRCRKRFA